MTQNDDVHGEHGSAALEARLAAELFLEQGGHDHVDCAYLLWFFGQVEYAGILFRDGLTEGSPACAIPAYLLDETPIEERVRWAARVCATLPTISRKEFARLVYVDLWLRHRRADLAHAFSLEALASDPDLDVWPLPDASIPRSASGAARFRERYEDFWRRAVHAENWDLVLRLLMSAALAGEGAIAGDAEMAGITREPPLFMTLWMVDTLPLQDLDPSAIEACVESVGDEAERTAMRVLAYDVLELHAPREAANLAMEIADSGADQLASYLRLRSQRALVRSGHFQAAADVVAARSEVCSNAEFLDALALLGTMYGLYAGGETLDSLRAPMEQLVRAGFSQRRIVGSEMALALRETLAFRRGGYSELTAWYAALEERGASSYRILEQLYLDSGEPMLMPVLQLFEDTCVRRPARFAAGFQIANGRLAPKQLHSALEAMVRSPRAADPGVKENVELSSLLYRYLAWHIDGESSQPIFTDTARERAEIGALLRHTRPRGLEGSLSEEQEAERRLFLLRLADHEHTEVAGLALLLLAHDSIDRGERSDASRFLGQAEHALPGDSGVLGAMARLSDAVAGEELVVLGPGADAPRPAAGTHRPATQDARLESALPDADESLVDSVCWGEKRWRTKLNARLREIASEQGRALMAGLERRAEQENTQEVRARIRVAAAHLALQALEDPRQAKVLMKRTPVRVLSGTDELMLGTRVLKQLEMWPDLAEALDRRASLERDPIARALIRRALAELLERRMGAKGRAVQALVAAFRDDPSVTELLPLLERRLSQSARYDALRQVYTAAIEAKKHTPELPYDLETLFASRGELEFYQLDLPEEAATSLTEALRRNPHDERYRGLVEVIATETGKPQLALEACDAQISAQGADDQGRIGALLAAAEIHLAGGDPVQAAESLRSAARLEPTRPEIAERLEAVYRTIGDDKRLAELLAQRASVAPTRAERVEVLAELATLQELKLHRVDAAIETYRALLELSPDSPHAVDLGRLFVSTERWEEAADILGRAALTRDPESRAVLFESVAEIYSEHLDAYQQALRFYKRALAQSPGSLTALLGVAEMQRRIEDWAGLVRTLTRIVSVAEVPRLRASSHVECAEVYLEKLGDRASAVREAQAALSEGGDNERAQALLASARRER